MARSSFPSPFSIYTTGLTAVFETSVRAQDVFLQQMDALSQRLKSQRDWSELRLPVPMVNTAHDAEATRDLFHQWANMNLRNWEILAETLQTLPDWAHKASRMPGDVLTDAFDKFRRDANGVMPGLAPTPATEAPVAAETIVAEKPAKPKKAKIAKKTKAKLKAAVDSKPKPKPDDLTRIKGIGPKLADKLNELGVQNFSQIASWTRKEVANIDEEIGGLGRIARDNWIAQAQSLSES